MFGRIFIYKLKEITRNRYNVGWNFIFPIVLATVFYLGFGNLIKDDPDSFSTIEAGYVNTVGDASPFEAVLTELSEDSKGQVAVLSIHKYNSKKEALKALDSGDISGIYLESEDGIETFVSKNGITSTTLNQIVREYENKKTIIETVAVEHPENLPTTIGMVMDNISTVERYDFGTNTSPYIQYFFALIAMSSLFSSWISTDILEGICANMTEQGKRFECSPTNKLMAISAGILAALTLQSVTNAIVVVYVQEILKIDFGAPLWNVLLLTTLGSALGVSAGVLIGSFIKNSHLLVVVPLCFTMTCSFCSGLMWHQVRQVIENNCPLLNRINPASLLVDSLFTLSTYGRTETYYRDVAIMCSMIVISLLVSAFLLRRRKYVSL